MQPSHDSIEHRTRHWVETMVVGLDLCPFAPKVIASDELRLQVCAEADMAKVLALVYQEAESALEAGGDATTLIVLPTGYDEFNDYLDLLAMAEELLVLQKLDQQVQIASFHPQYVFEGSDENDPANYSNRSPYPMLHLLQEASVTRAVDHYDQAHLIAEQNIAKLEALGLSGVLERLKV